MDLGLGYTGGLLKCRSGDLVSDWSFAQGHGSRPFPLTFGRYGNDSRSPVP